MLSADPEAGFTLIEVMIASALFVVVAFAGFEAVRQLGAGVVMLAQRADAAAQLAVAEGELRSAALSSVAVFAPPSGCGDAVEFLQRDAAGTSFLLFATHTNAQGSVNLVRASGAGPLNPCDTTLATQTVIAGIDAFTVTTFTAAQLAAHTDPIGGQPDGGILVPGGSLAIAVDAHDKDFDGSTIATGNDVVEVTIDADPAVTAVDLVAGNRPSGFTEQLAYTCNGRCEATVPFGEIRGGMYTDCTSSIAFANSAAYYAPATYAFHTLASGQQQIIVTSYAVTGQYLFAFSGPSPLTVARTWPVAVWPPAGSPLAGTIADPWPIDYASNAVAMRGAAQIASDIGEPATYAAELSACADMDAESGNLFGA